MGTLLAGKTVIVTGAGRGIGLATALHLLDEGAQVVATVRYRTPAQLKVDDDKLVARVVDVTDEQQVKESIAFTVERSASSTASSTTPASSFPARSWTRP